MKRAYLLAGPAALSLCFGVTFLAGCGGSSKLGGTAAATPGTPAASASSGRAAFTIQWPKRTSPSTSRLIPEAANLIQINILRTVNGVTKVIASSSAVRSPDGSSATVSFGNLPIDTLIAVATAYPGTDAANPGVALASGSLSFATQDGSVVTPPTLTMGSTIDHLAVTPGTSTLTVGAGAETLIVTAYDASGDVVLLSADKISWASSSAAIAAVDAASGVVTPAAAGAATIVATDSESGKTASASVTVQPAPTPTPTPTPTPLIGPEQFNPSNPAYAGTTKITDPSGGWVAASGSFVFDSDALTLKDSSGNLIATGIKVTNLGTDYAVFDFPASISLSGCKVTGTGALPFVILTQGNFTLNGGASIDFSATGTTPGAGGAAAGKGAGAGNEAHAMMQVSYGSVNLLNFDYAGGGSFGGAGGPGGANGANGSAGSTYGADFATVTPTTHLQGGSGGGIYNASLSPQGNGGGAVYIASSGLLTVNGAAIKANGASTLFSSQQSPPPTGGGAGSGGGIALFGGTGVQLTSAAITANGGDGDWPERFTLGDTQYNFYFYEGGGGRIVIGYPMTTSAPDMSQVTAKGGSGDREAGSVTTLPFAAF